MAKGQLIDVEEGTRTLAIAIATPQNRHLDKQAYFEEFKNLAASDKRQIDAYLEITLRTVDTTNFFTKGKLLELKEQCEKIGPDEILISEPLTPRQEKNLEDMLGCPITDRTALILSIFDKTAVSAEGKTQIEIAALRYQKGRVAGKGIYLSQQSGIIGARGPGETLKEKTLRYLEENIERLRKRLKALEKTRATQRKRRISRQIPQICLTGYTSAGKSTIINRLTKSDVTESQKLFATLDTTTRELYIGGTKIGVLSDTVGFIQKLPPQLIDAFKSTLSELCFADLVLHIIDASDKNMECHIETVERILKELGVTAETLYVFNKIDKVSNQEELEERAKAYNPHVFVSATTKGGLEALKNFVLGWATRE